MIWREMAVAAPDGVLTGSDRGLLEVAVRLIAEMRRDGGLAMTKYAMLLKCLSEMGMTPASRSKIAVAPAKIAESEWDEMGLR